MEFFIYDTNLVLVGVIDDAESAIWTTRYYKPGDFELYLRASSQASALLKKNYYVGKSDSSSLCMVERIGIQEDEEEGDHYVVSGRDLKSLLERRIIWEQTMLNGKVEQCLRRLILENAIETTPERVIPGLILGAESLLPASIKKQITGTNLMESIQDICITYQYGWDVLFLDGNFPVMFYKGTDRSYNQTNTDNPYVVFSAEFDNLISSVYAQDASQYRNVALVAGEGEGKARKKTVVGEASGLDRYELYVDARDVSSNEGEISDAEYLAQLYGRGMEKLEAASRDETFEAVVDNTNLYIMGKDYFMGDIVTVQNKYGVRANARVVEMIENWSDGGYTAVPTLETWIEEGKSWR